MKIAVVGPIATRDVAQYLDRDTSNLPVGYPGAPILATLIGELLKRGWDVTGITTTPEVVPNPREWRCSIGHRFSMYYCGARKHAFRPSCGMLGRAVDQFRVERAAIRNVLQGLRPSVVHAHWSYEFGLAATESSFPSVVTCHDSPLMVLHHMPNMYRAIRYVMARRCLSRSTFFSAVSPYISGEVQRHTRCPVQVIPNPLPGLLPLHSAASQIERRANSLKASPKVAMVMNGWNRLKNPIPALEAFGQYRLSHPEAELMLFGADYGPGEAAEAWARSRGLLVGVKLFGRLDHRDLLDRLQTAHLLLHPSLLEGCPMSVAEAMAWGLPIVGGRHSGGLPWVVGDGGQLTDVRASAAILQSLHEILGDKDRYTRYAATAFKRAAQMFCPSTVARSYEELYAKAVERYHE